MKIEDFYKAWNPKHIQYAEYLDENGYNTFGRVMDTGMSISGINFAYIDNFATRIPICDIRKIFE